ncbi:MAG: hypothetical protein MUC43_09945 [Pirellula sp.]|nr:hypothetical protein [Pirellula sp.]
MAHRTLAIESVIGLNLLMAIVLARAAWVSSPTFDETAHFASGIVLAQYADPGYFRVNPPANKWLIAIIEPIIPALELPPVVPSTQHGNASRIEFQFGQQVMADNPANYRRGLWIARMARIPVMLLGSWLLWISCASLPWHARILVQAFWCTSPLILGHGWIVSADAPAGVAMAAILWTALPLMRHALLRFVVFSGVAWGMAIGTKFTFAPLYVAFPVVIEGIRWATRQEFSWRRLLLRWPIHALVACMTLHALYLFQEPLVPIGKHEFVSKEFRDFRFERAERQSTFHRMIAEVPSPFPRLFLEGIDQQLADMNRPRGAYLLGRRIEGPLPWFFLVAFWIKEQPAVAVALCMGLFGIVIKTFRGRRGCGKGNEDTTSVLSSGSLAQDESHLSLFCLVSLMSMILLFTTQENLVWNMRYLIPVLPLLYVLVAEVVFASRTVELFGGRLEMVITRGFLGVIVVLMVWDMSMKWAHPFSYANPLFGGTYRNPMALNDSNFDYGQDVYHVADWLKREKSERGKDKPIYRVVSGFGRDDLNLWSEVANREQIDRAISNAKNRDAQTESNQIRTPLVVSRSLYHAEPWGIRYSDFDSVALAQEELSLLRELLLMEPDVWITPTVAVYDCGE